MGGLSLRVRALSFFVFLGIFAALLAGVSPSRADRSGGDDAPPVADAGRDAVAGVGDVVVLDGAGSTDPESDGLAYVWRLVERPGASAAALSDIAAVKPTVTIDADGRYLFELVVISDEETYSAPDYVEVNTRDVAPAADAGADLSVAAGRMATLDGAGSGDAGGDRLGYTWRLASKPAGSAAVIADAGAIRPTLPIDVAGTYVAELEVTDGMVTGVADRVLLSTGSIAPAANAGADQPAKPYAPLVLDAELTGDADGDILSFHWSLLSGVPGAETELARRHARRAAFVFSEAGDYVLQLTATDADGAVTRDTLVVSSGNTRPVADAGSDLAITPGAALRLDGTGSTDLDGDRLRYRWALLAAPEGSAAALLDDASPRPWFEPDVAGSYVLQLTVGDGVTWSAPDAVVLSTANLPPVAEAGPDRWMAERGPVALDGLASTDGNGDALSYRWALLDGPRGSRAVLDGAASAEAGFTADRRGTYVAQLVVNDGQADSAPSLVVIGVGKGAWGDDKESEYDDLLDEHDGDDRDDESDDDKHAALDGARLVLAAYVPDTQGSNGKGHDEDQSNGKGHEEHGQGNGYGHDEDGGDDEDEDDDDKNGGKQAGFSGHPGDVNIRPVAEPGMASRVAQGALVQLDGGNSNDANSDALVYNWALIAAPEGSTAELDDAASITPSFTADLPGFYVAQLVVSDGLMRSFPKTVAVQVNIAPVADAGPDLDIGLGDTALLDGSGSYDPDGDPLSYAWSVASAPEGSIAAITDATAEIAGFTPDIDGVYEIQLIVNDGLENSAPDTATITVFSNPPVAEAGDDQIVTVGSVATLDGAASYDPDGQAITWQWRFTARPKDSAAVLVNPTSANPTFTADVEGLYVLDLVVSDGRLDSRPDVVAVRAGSGVINTAPVLAAVGARTVELGSALSFTLSATDADDDPVSYFATPLPLPANASLAAASGAFTFRPDADQIGGYTITFGASDGLDSDSESVPITVTAPPAGTVTTFSARVLDADSAALGQEVGVAGVTVRLVNTGISAVTALDGSFTLSNVPSGDQVLYMDASTATPFPDPAPKGTPYASLREGVTLLAGVVNAGNPFFLARLDLASQTAYNPAGTTVTNTTLGTTITVAANSAKNPDGSPFTGTFTISDIPTDEIAALLPAYMSPCNVITFQSEPSGLTFSPAASVTLGNPDNLPPGSIVEIWGLGGASETFFLATTATVSADGHSINVGPLVGRTPSVFFAIPRAPTAVAAIDMNGVNRRPTLFGDGNLSQALSLPGYQWLGREQSTTFVYNSATADPRPIVAAEVTFPANTGLPLTLQGRLEVGGAAVAGPVYMGTNGYTDPVTGETRPPLAAGQPIRQALQFDAAAVPTGSYPYRYIASSQYKCSRVGTPVDGRVLVNNQSDSDFGAGWTLNGLHRVTEQDDGRLVLEDGAGATTVFEPVFSRPIFEFEDFGDLAGFKLNGSASAINATPVTFGGQTVLRMTNGLNQSGSAFLNEAVPLQFEGGALSFSSEFTFQFSRPGGISDRDGRGADGITLAIVNAPTVTGGLGGGIGYQGLAPSVAVEFDTYDNGNFAAIRDPDGNHVGIDVNGSLRSVVTAPVSARMNNGAVWYAWVDYIGDSKTLEVRLAQTPARPLDPILTRVVDIPAIIGSTTAYMGFTSGTGAARNDHDIRSWKVRVSGYDVNIGYASPVSDFSVMAKNTDGTLTRFMKDGMILEFNADGRQTAEIDPNGNRTAYEYDAQGRLARIVKTPGDLITAFVYNAAGQLESITEPDGRATAYAYDPLGTLLKVTYPDGSVVRYRYTEEGKRMTDVASERGFVTTHDYGFAGQWIGSGFPDGSSISASISESLGLAQFDIGLGGEDNPQPYVLPEDRITRMQDAKGNILEIEVNEFGQTVRVTDPIGRITRIERGADNLVRRVEKPTDGDPSGLVVTGIDYDERGNVVAQTEATGSALARTTRFEYEPEYNRVVKIIDASNSDPAPACGTAGVTCFEYDEFGNQTRVIDGAGGTQVSTYLANGQKFTARDANGNQTQFFYNITGDLTRAIDAELNETRMDYDNAGNLLSQTDGFGTPAARTTSFTYDDLNRLLTETGAEGAVTETVYDADGNVIAEIDVTGIAKTSEYDEMGRLAAEFHPATGTVQRTYDANGNMTSMIDPTGNIAHFQYDAMNRATRTEDPAGGIRLFAYDSQDNPVEITDANGNVTSFKYDPLGREIERRNTLGDTWTFAYDSRDNMVETADAKGQRIEKAFDALNRMIGVTTVRADGSQEDVQTFAYDALGQKTAANDNDSALAWTYDAANRVVTAETIAGLTNAQPAVTLTHDYDAVGNRTSLSDSAGGSIWFSHDGEGRLTQITTASNDTIDLVYDVAGRLERIANTNAVATDVAYDPTTGRPQSIAHRQGAATLAGFGYGFDTDGKITSIVDNGGTRDFTYDATLQVTSGGYASARESYSYDAEGNRTKSHLSTTYTTDTANRLIEDADACYVYDANGNLETKTARTGVTCAGGVTAYTWDVLNRLVAIDFADGTSVQYHYDAQGRRVEKDVNGAITRYVYDDDAILLEYDGANALQARYSHGEEIDQPLAMARGGQSYFYQTDHLGSIRLLTDAAGAIVNRYDYDAFGNMEPTSFEGITNPYAFTARERDAESGLMFYRARYYDPKLGRFISEDPIGFEAGDLNVYRYVFNGPVMFVDPTGEFSFGMFVQMTIIATVATVTTGGVLGGIVGYLTTDDPICGAITGFTLGAVGGLVPGAIAAIPLPAWAGASLGIVLDALFGLALAPHTTTPKEACGG